MLHANEKIAVFKKKEKGKIPGKLKKRGASQEVIVTRI